MQRAGNQEIAWEMAFLSRFTALRTVTSSSAEILPVYVGILDVERACHIALLPAAALPRWSNKRYSAGLIWGETARDTFNFDSDPFMWLTGKLDMFELVGHN